MSDIPRHITTSLPKALTAIRAVLELHKPVKHRDYTGSDRRENTACEECTLLVNKYAEWDHEETYVEYPCPTVRAIEGVISE